MGTVTGYTAARMQAIEDGTVVDGNVVAGHLILEKHNGDTVDAGSVIGPTGLTGPPGDVSTGDLDDLVLATGKGLVAFAQKTDMQSFAFAANDWEDIDDLVAAFVPIPGNYYEFSIYVPIVTMDPGGTEFDVVLKVTTGQEIFRATAHPKANGKIVGASASSTLLAPDTWTTSKSFKVSIRADTEYEYQIKADTYKACVSVKDLGTMS